MRFPDSAYLQRVESMTDEIEQGSAAEVVVTIASRSGTYRDVDQTWAASFALATLLVLVLSPTIVVSEIALIPSLLIAYGVGWFCSRRSPAMRRLLTTRGRREAQVRDAARSAFLGEALDATPGRVGVLIYVSLLEREVEVIADHGIPGALGQAPVRAFVHAIRQAPDRDLLDAFLKAFETFGQALKTGLPATAETVHGIPNRPRVVQE